MDTGKKAKIEAVLELLDYFLDLNEDEASDYERGVHKRVLQCADNFDKTDCKTCDSLIKEAMEILDNYCSDPNDDKHIAELYAIVEA